MFKEATIQGKISGPVMIVSVTQKQTRTSKPYLILKLRDDQKKEVDAKLWNMSVEEFPFDKNTVIIGEFSVGEYNGQKDFTLDMYREALELDLQNDENKDKILLLKHLLASHHGKQEYGAITVPQLPEAIMLNRIDMIDAEMYQCEHALEDQSNGTFTDRIFGLNNTRLYKPL